jgi:N6-L-threonylcarbamoyladenine synthase
LKVENIDSIAVTYGPGLAPCLEVGIETAVKLARKWDRHLIAVNHMEGHLLSSLAKNGKGNGGAMPEFPALGFIISGGHTELVLMQDFGKYELLGETLDDAAGEAYDKVARMLNLGYPGGPILSALAQKGNPTAFPFPEPMRLRMDLNFSFSGIKTAALYKLKSLGQLDKQQTEDFAASFQAAVLKMLMRRFKRAIELYAPKSVLLGGGVVSNVVIRNETRKVARKYGLKVHIPYNQKLITDNAAMIGVAGWYQAMRGEFVEDLDALDRQPNLNFKSRE